MHIERIILEGFKSYGGRTEICGLHPQFNAITGQNGSGKSNILDATSFALGLNKPELMRAKDMAELIYLKGQQGITKAEVTLVFNNEDEERCPLPVTNPYRQQPKITCTRLLQGSQRKWFINGSVVKEKAYHDFFAAAGLSIQYPYFLIQQGKITQTIGFRPHRFLEMLEEAAGTKTYQNKRDTTKKKIEAKEKELARVDDKLEQEFIPERDRLNKERVEYLQFEKIRSTIHQQQRFVNAITYYEHLTVQKSGQQQLAQLVKEREELDAQMESLQKELADKKKEFDKRMKARNEDAEFTRLQELLSKRTTEMEGAQTKLDNAKKDVVEAEKEVSSQQKKLKGHEKDVNKKDNEHKQLQTQLQSLLEAKDQLEKKQDKLNRKLHDIRAGREVFVADEGDEQEGQSVRERLAAAKQKRAEIDTKLKQCARETKHLEEKLEKADDIDANDPKLKAYNALCREKSECEVNIRKWQDKLNALDFDAYAWKARQDEYDRIHKEELPPLRHDEDTLRSRLLGRCTYNREKVPDLDPQHVKGAVGELVHLKPDMDNYSKAIEVASLAKLFNVIVETEKDATELLDKKAFEQDRVTCLPLNRLQDKVVANETVEAAQRVSDAEGEGDTILKGIDVVEYPPEVAKAMRFVFGRLLLCESKVTAGKVYAHPSARTRIITQNGDVYDPSGAIGGGSSKNLQLLEKFKALASLRERLTKLEERAKELKDWFDAQAQTKKDHDEYSKKLDYEQRRLNRIQERINQDEIGAKKDEIEQAKTKLDELKASSVELTSEAGKTDEAIQELEASLANFQNNKGQMEQEVEQMCRQAKEDAEKADNEHNELQERHNRVGVELQAMRQNITEKEEDLKAAEAQLAKCQEHFAEKEQQYQDAVRWKDEVLKKVEESKKNLSQLDEALNQLQQDERELEKQKHNTELAKARKNNQYETKKKEVAHADAEVRKYRARMPDTVALEPELNKEGGDYDFRGTTANVERGRYEKMRQDYERLEPRVNKEAYTKWEALNAKIEEWKTKRGIVEREKEDLEKDIKKYDQKRIDELNSCWKIVNDNFGKIFGTMLPGASARLAVPEGHRAKDFLKTGLEMKVCVDRVWKDSLSSLSGGQKSLVALALLLAINKYKPGPLFLLDEVDAALDPNHTSNMGAMIRQHFPDSQFILVSLKEGMHRHANILFRVRSVHGVSEVTRIVQRQEGAAPPHQAGRGRGRGRKRRAEKDDDDDGGQQEEEEEQEE
ncbi:unnamed protein product [Vitrella brassicaformis CCMP3155]|uniref:Structural maintenance of chromosomes protein n=1 Tax=Vitrella brassicaformis (strain CCMP3155) TaxID=1169540 RepID=A0A0G4EGI5_VITBC|nr:unnamed protein product [Vitrella brassicaformis CCMP3155]|eukprot:CEL94539.1 unnamed protein product [Vitrella brassicaformis CCMP3155]